MILETSERITIPIEQLPDSDELADRMYDKLLQSDFIEITDDTPREGTLKIEVVDEIESLTDEQKQKSLHKELRYRAESIGWRSWWNQARHSVESLVSDAPTPERKVIAESALAIRTVHKFKVQTENGTDGIFQVIECGAEPDAALTAGELNTISSTLTIID